MHNDKYSPRAVRQNRRARGIVMIHGAVDRELALAVYVDGKPVGFFVDPLN
jgi:hypothetical protein